MSLSNWKPGTIYIPGSLVLPTTVVGAVATAIPNADFESGDSGWSKSAGWLINANRAFTGIKSAEYFASGVGKIVSTTRHDIAPGKAVTASCFIDQTAFADGDASLAVILEWYDGAGALISTSTGNAISTGTWRKSTVSATAPATAAKVAIGCSANIGASAYAAAVAALATVGELQLEDNSGPLLNEDGTDVFLESAYGCYADSFSWNYVVGAAATGLAYKAIQTDAGTSGSSEPAWPTTVGLTVVDNEVTWEAVGVDSVTWEASSVLTSGSVEPAWPTETGSYVADNNIAWETVPLRITDENCPHSKVVAIAASKVFAGDTDVTRFCATLNARDWSSENDAGFLPTGLQQKSQVGVTAMGVYRGNLAVWSPSTFQVWQVDPDPAAMALLDAMEGLGSMHQQAVQPVSDDLFFLAALGVRTVSIAAGSNNLASGDVGVPIDTLVQTEVNAGDVEPVASYYPSAGQYWLAFRPLLIGATLLAGQFLLTSPPYPIEATDSLAFEATFLGGYTQGVNKDSVDFSARHLNSTLVSVALETDPQLEGVDFSSTHLDSALDLIRLYTDPQTESVDFSAAHLDSELDQALVRHTNPAEALDWEVEWTGGSTS